MTCEIATEGITYTWDSHTVLRKQKEVREIQNRRFTLLHHQKSATLLTERIK